MVFKRRKRLGWLAALKNMIYPTGGFRRATWYVIYRMRRLPDQPHRIARGMAAGFFIGFLPLPGLQFVAAVILGWMMRGNIIAAILGTFNSNPITTPFYAVISIKLGHWMLGEETPLSAHSVGKAFVKSGQDLWENVQILFKGGDVQLEGLQQFWNVIYVPYFIGSLIPGIISGVISYYITLTLVRAYQKVRAAQIEKRKERKQRFKDDGSKECENSVKAQKKAAPTKTK